MGIRVASSCTVFIFLGRALSREKAEVEWPLISENSEALQGIWCWILYRSDTDRINVWVSEGTAHRAQVNHTLENEASSIHCILSPPTVWYIFLPVEIEHRLLVIPLRWKTLSLCSYQWLSPVISISPTINGREEPTPRRKDSPKKNCKCVISVLMAGPRGAFS